LGIERFRSFLRRHRRIALDTSIFIYQLEADARYAALSDTVFSWVERPGCAAVTSTVTMTELLVQPYRNHDQEQADEIYALLSTYPHLEWIAPNLEIGDAAARLRALHNLRTPDALQAATAMHALATGMVTNDPVFARIGAFETAVLDQFV
jgi:predicted nucleic acid-binding protein